MKKRLIVVEDHNGELSYYKTLSGVAKDLAFLDASIATGFSCWGMNGRTDKKALVTIMKDHLMKQEVIVRFHKTEGKQYIVRLVKFADVVVWE